MPLVPTSPYRPVPYQPGGHLQTIIPSTWRQVPEVRYRREQLELPDGDFLALDWALAGAGPAPRHHYARLEGSSQRAYMRGMARTPNQAGVDVLA